MIHDIVSVVVFFLEAARSQARASVRLAFLRAREVAMQSVHDVTARLRAEFIEMPGLQLTPKQIQRLCGIEANVCRVVIDSLVYANFLCVTANGSYGRPREERIVRARPAKATIPNALEHRDVPVHRRTA
jgi:hypothetical protein